MSLGRTDDHAGISHGVEHDHDSDPFANIDPSLHPDGTQDRLARFAQHVLTETDAQDPPSFLGLGGSGEEGTLFSAAGDSRFTELLEAAGEAGAGGVTGNGAGAIGVAIGNAAQAAGVDGHDDDGMDKDEDYNDFTGDENGEGEDGKEPGAKFGRIVGRKRRRDDNEPIVVGPVENGEPIDPVKMKKDSHKEVERRRRENINDGINEIARFVPGAMEGKVGKGLLLRRAAEYMADLSDKAARHDEEVAKVKQEKDALQTELDEARQKLQEEQSRSIRYEVSWRDAEDRAAATQFQLDRANARVAELEKEGKK